MVIGGYPGVAELKFRGRFRIATYPLESCFELCLSRGIHTCIRFRAIRSLFLRIVENNVPGVTELPVKNRLSSCIKIDS